MNSSYPVNLTERVFDNWLYIYTCLSEGTRNLGYTDIRVSPKIAVNLFVEDIKKKVDSFLIKRKYISYLIEWLHSSIFGGGSREHFGLQGTTFSVLGISTSATEKGGLSRPAITSIPGLVHLSTKSSI